MDERTEQASKILGRLGAEVMEVLWSAGEPITVRMALERLNEGRAEPLAYTTVMTVLARLAERGAAKRTAAGRGYRYEPAVADAAELAVRNVVRDHGEAAVAHFVDQARADPRLLRRLEQLLDGPAQQGDP
ncbi:BlaI/MecI/CopY family transcriptional regulator [Haloechinothrix halophila]|uniref:BlaI/MecI/CopY family transcriptional regulator n=1 Tax=Haloechinothrix halophila TaxID=1069073 RepID=UPI0003F74289|nr:BlaI/MecI/CopY family transcriptional regulator [Haloechinothrix halophila]